MRFFLPVWLLLLPALLLAAPAEKRRVYAPSQQSIVYSGAKLTLPAPVVRPEPFSRWYAGFSGRYATGEETARTQLSEAIYREDTIKLADQDVSMVFGYGTMGGDRIELAVVPFRSFSYQDSLSEPEFGSGRGLDLSYSFAMGNLYQESSPDNLIPFIKIGVGVSLFDVGQDYAANYESDTILANDYILGIGTLFQMGRRVSFTVSYEMREREFQDITRGSYLRKTSQRLNGVGIGLNYHF